MRDLNLAYSMQEIAANVFHEPMLEPRLHHYMVVGAARKVGTSFVARGLAQTLGLSGHRVLLIEVLRRRPGQGELSRLLASPATASVQHPMVLKVGSSEIAPLVLPGSQAFGEMSRLLHTHFDAVIWDVPPPAPASPGVVIARLMDSVMLVIEANRTQRAAAAYAADRLRDGRGRLLGVVMNRIPRRTPGWLMRAF